MKRCRMAALLSLSIGTDRHDGHRKHDQNHNHGFNITSTEHPQQQPIYRSEREGECCDPERRVKWAKVCGQRENYARRHKSELSAPASFLRLVPFLIQDGINDEFSVEDVKNTSGVDRQLIPSKGHCLRFHRKWGTHLDTGATVIDATDHLTVLVQRPGECSFAGTKNYECRVWHREEGELAGKLFPEEIASVRIAPLTCPCGRPHGEREILLCTSLPKVAPSAGLPWAIFLNPVWASRLARTNVRESAAGRNLEC